MPSAAQRVEERTALKVTVDLSSVDARMPAREGITENVSAHGARVVVSRALPMDARLNVRSIFGSLKSRGRVVYCERLGNGMFAVGLELLATAGEWVIPGAMHGKQSGKPA